MATLFRKKRAESLLEFIMAFTALLILAVGLTRIWVWFNANYAKLNVDYQNTRLSSGQGSAPGAFNPQPLQLTTDWVFRGQPSGSVGAFTGGTSTSTATTSGGSSGADTICTNATTAAETMHTQADEMRDQADQLDDFVSYVDYDRWWKVWEYALRLLVEQVMDIDIGDIEEGRDDLYTAADEIDVSADAIEDAACGASDGSYTTDDVATLEQELTGLTYRACWMRVYSIRNTSIPREQETYQGAGECVDMIDLWSNPFVGDPRDYYCLAWDNDCRDTVTQQYNTCMTAASGMEDSPISQPYGQAEWQEAISRWQTQMTEISNGITEYQTEANTLETECTAQDPTHAYDPYYSN